MVKNDICTRRVQYNSGPITHQSSPDPPPSKQWQPTLQTLKPSKVHTTWFLAHLASFTANLLYPLGASASASAAPRSPSPRRRPPSILAHHAWNSACAATPRAHAHSRPATRGYWNEINLNLIDCPALSANPWHKRAPGNQLGFKPEPALQTSMAEASASAEAEARSILERAAESSFPPLHAVHHLLSVGVRLLLPAHVLLKCWVFTNGCLISNS